MRNTAAIDWGMKTELAVQRREPQLMYGRVAQANIYLLRAEGYNHHTQTLRANYTPPPPPFFAHFQPPDPWPIIQA